MMIYEVAELFFQRSERFTLRIERLMLEAGEKVAIVGPNGSGKTTLLRLLAFLEAPTTCGRFLYRGRPAGVGRMDRRGLGFVKQHPYLFSGTVRQNAAYPLQLRGCARDAIRRQTDEALGRVDLAHLADASVRHLSGGEQKRLALARVLISDPDVLLLDEPIAHLDRRSQAVVEETIRESRAGLLVATHDMRFAHRVASRILSLKGGRLTPALPGNVLEGRRAGAELVTAGGLRIHLPPVSEESAAVDPPGPGAGQTTAVMIDPRSLVLSREPLRSSMRNRFSGRVCGMHETAGQIWVEIDCGERLTAIISEESYRDLGLNLGVPVEVSFKASSVEVL